MDVECGWEWISKSKQGKQSKFIQQKGKNCLTNQWWSHTGSILATQERIRSYCWFFPSDVGFVKEVSFQDILHWMVCSGSRGCCGNPLVGNDWYAGVREAMGACGRDTSVAAIATQTSWSRCYFENGIGDCDWQFEEPWSCCWQCWKDIYLKNLNEHKFLSFVFLLTLELGEVRLRLEWVEESGHLLPSPESENG